MFSTRSERDENDNNLLQWITVMFKINLTIHNIYTACLRKRFKMITKKITFTCYYPVYFEIVKSAQMKDRFLLIGTHIDCLIKTYSYDSGADAAG